MQKEEVEAIVHDAQRKGKIIGVRMSLTEEGNEDPWTLPPSGRKVEKTIQGPFPEKVSIVVGNMVYIEKVAYPQGWSTDLSDWRPFRIPSFIRLRPCAYQLMASRGLYRAPKTLINT
jgi:ribosomal protein L2